MTLVGAVRVGGSAWFGGSLGGQIEVERSSFTACLLSGFRSSGV